MRNASLFIKVWLAKPVVLIRHLELMQMKNIFLAVVLILLNTVSQQAWANRCDYDAKPGPLVYTAPLTVNNISVGTDLPVGSIVHTMQILTGADTMPWNRCTPENGSSGFSIDQYLYLINAPALVSGYTGIYQGAVYQTSLPGLGFAIINNDGYTAGQPVTIIASKKWTTPVGSTPYHFYYNNRMTLALIKTGPIRAGVVNGAQFGTILMTTNSATPVTNVPMTPYRISFSGSINVIAATCTTPDVNVDMHKWQMSDWFGATKPNATPWVPFNINLTNCPAFFGKYSDVNSPPTLNTDSGFTAGRLVNNAIHVSFTPNNGAIDATQGIINIDSGADAAKGIGIQVAQGKTSPVPIDLTKGIDQTLVSAGASNFAVEMSARYVGNPTQPGAANAKMVFTINYY